MSALDADTQIESFIAKFSDDVAPQIRAARAAMRARLPGAVEMAYDNYNALAIGYGATEKLSDLVFSIAAFPRWVRLFFYRGAELDDPDGRLEGEGAQVRSILFTGPAVLDEPTVRALMDQALRRARTPIDSAQPSRTVVKSISAKQRPRWHLCSEARTHGSSAVLAGRRGAAVE